MKSKTRTFKAWKRKALRDPRVRVELRKTEPDGGGLRDNAGKPRWDLLPLDAVEQVVHVLTAGAKKYAERNWERGMSYSKVQASLTRHLVRRALGEMVDPETGMLHTAAIACNALFLCAYDKRGLAAQLDDMEPFARAARRRKR